MVVSSFSPGGKKILASHCLSACIYDLALSWNIARAREVSEQYLRETLLVSDGFTNATVSHGLDAAPISNQWVNLRVLEAFSRQKAMTTVNGDESQGSRDTRQSK